MNENSRSSRELYFLYELAKVLASSIDLAEVTEYVIDGTCALLGTEEGFLLLLDGAGALRHHASRGLTVEELGRLAGQVRPAVDERRAVALAHPRDPQGAVLVAPLVARNSVQGLIGVATTYPRCFTAAEEERLAAVAHLASLAMENARLHERVQRELSTLQRLIQAAQKMGAGQLSPEEAAELEKMEGWDEIAKLGQVFGQMAQQVMRREEDLRRQVAELRIEIEIDETKRARQVAEITETEYFQELREKAKRIRGLTK